MAASVSANHLVSGNVFSKKHDFSLLEKSNDPKPKKKTGRKHVSLSEKSNDIKKQQQQQQQPLRTTNIKTANVKSKVEKLISKMVEFSEMKFLMTPLFYYSGNSLDVSERLI